MEEFCTLGIVFQAGGHSVGLESQILVPQSVNCKRLNTDVLLSLLYDPKLSRFNVSPSSHALGSDILLSERD